MQTSLITDVTSVAEKAAIACAPWIGHGDKVAADQAATEAMRAAFNDVAIDGRIVIGEGERDEAPMLFIGEELGSGGPAIDIAVDPLEGTNLCAYDRPAAWCTIAIAPRGALLYAPDTYMWKVAAGPACKGKVSIEMSPADNVRAVADALGKPTEEVCVCILERDRHAAIISELHEVGCRVKTIDDGDVYWCIATALPDSGVDLVLGAGGSPEAVLSATGLRAIGGEFSARLGFDADPHGPEKRERAAKTSGLDDLDAPLSMDDLVKSDDAAFIGCAVTSSELLDGVHAYRDGAVTTETLVLSAADRSVRRIRTCHRGDGAVRL